MRQWDLNVFARTDSKLFLGSGCIYTNAWTNTVWDLKVWLWLALFYQKEICFVNSWKLIPSAVKSLAIWLLFSLRVYFVCYRESLKVVFHKILWSSILCASDTLPMKNWKPYGCWDVRGGVCEVLLLQLDSVAFLAISSTQSMAFSRIMPQERAAKGLISVLVRPSQYSCPFKHVYLRFFWNLRAFMKIFTERIAQVASLQWWV